MLQEVADSVSNEKNEKITQEYNTMIKCSRKDCKGFSYAAGVKCTLCHQIIQDLNSLDAQSDCYLQLNSCVSRGESIDNEPNIKVRRIDSSEFLASGTVFIVGRVVFDICPEPCVISSNSISFNIKCEGESVRIVILYSDVNVVQFCEELQLIFIRPKDFYKQEIIKKLKVANDRKKQGQSHDKDVKWIILVLSEISKKPISAMHLTVSTFEKFCSMVRKNEGYCNENLPSLSARNLLINCNLMLDRLKSISDPSSHTALSLQRTEFNNKNMPTNNSLIANSASGGLLTSVISGLTSVSPKSGMTRNRMPPGKKASCSSPNNCISPLQALPDTKLKTLPLSTQIDGDDLIILAEEGTRNTSKLLDTFASDNRNSNCEEDIKSQLVNQDHIANNTGDANEQGSESAFKFNYRPNGSPDTLTLTSEDLACLMPGALLNDTIINFYLKYLYYERLSPLQRHSAYLFNSFFYNRLIYVKDSAIQDSTTAGLPISANTRFGGSPSNQGLPGQNNTPKQKLSSVSGTSVLDAKLAHHANVAKWTRRVDLFSKDHIIIPINENSHWFLGLVCYPWMAGMVSYTKLYQEAAVDKCRLTEAFADVDQMQLTPADQECIAEEQIEHLPSDQLGEAFDRWRRRRLAWLRNRGINVMPCILLFDSLHCVGRVGNLNFIRDYFQVEWDVRRSARDGPLHFNKDTIRGFTPYVPGQSNLVDCGIYLLHYVEMFFQTPVQSYTKDYFQHEMFSWFLEDAIAQKRTFIENVINRLYARYQAEEQTASNNLNNRLLS